MKTIIASLKLYGPFILLVASWWYFAFKDKSFPENSDLGNLESQKNTSNSLSFPLLSSIKRDILWEALSGDTSLMLKLMTEWDIDAQIMQAEGLTTVKRLIKQDYLRAQVLGRQLKKSSPDQLHVLREKYRRKIVIDDVGNRLYLATPFQKFLPQTFASASFLLALNSPKEIVALPRNLREQTQIYRQTLTDQVVLDCDRYNSEKLFLAHPQVAFIAHYSHPATIQALRNQGVKLYTMKTLSSIEDICDELLAIGNVVNRPQEAELLKIFIEAAMLAIDNRMASLNLYLANQTPQSILFLSHHQSFFIPSSHSLTGQLLQRLEIPKISIKNFAKKESQEWSIPIDKESILQLNPDCVIISTENGDALKRDIYNDPVWSQLSAVQKKHLFFVDEAIQQSPSQYIVLAYHDLFQALANLK